MSEASRDIGLERFDLVGHVVHVHDRGGDVRVGEAVEHVVDQRLAGDLDQRFRQAVGDRAHPRAEARGEDHGGFRHIRRRHRSISFWCQGSAGGISPPSARGRCA